MFSVARLWWARGAGGGDGVIWLVGTEVYRLGEVGWRAFRESF